MYFASHAEKYMITYLGSDKSYYDIKMYSSLITIQMNLAIEEFDMVKGSVFFYCGSCFRLQWSNQCPLKMCKLLARCLNC